MLSKYWIKLGKIFFNFKKANSWEEFVSLVEKEKGFSIEAKIVFEKKGLTFWYFPSFLAQKNKEGETIGFVGDRLSFTPGFLMLIFFCMDAEKRLPGVRIFLMPATNFRKWKKWEGGEKWKKQEVILKSV